MAVTAFQASTVRRAQTHERLRRYLEPLLVLAAFATVPLTLAELHGDRGRLFDIGDWTIWALFAVELAVLAYTAADRAAFLKAHWIFVVVVVVSVPLLPSVLAFSRAARLLRLLRLVRLGAVLAAALPALRETLARKGLLYVGATTLLVVVVAGGALTAVEPSLKGDFWSGLWWAIVTTTTVGYGDISPNTLPGRVVAVVLMVIGIGLTATFAASVAAFFVGQDADSDTKELLRRLDRIEKAIDVLTARTESQDRSSPLR